MGCTTGHACVLNPFLQHSNTACVAATRDAIAVRSGFFLAKFRNLEREKRPLRIGPKEFGSPSGGKLAMLIFDLTCADFVTFLSSFYAHVLANAGVKIVSPEIRHNRRFFSV